MPLQKQAILSLKTQGLGEAQAAAAGLARALLLGAKAAQALGAQALVAGRSLAAVAGTAAGASAAVRTAFGNVVAAAGRSSAAVAGAYGVMVSSAQQAIHTAAAAMSQSLAGLVGQAKAAAGRVNGALGAIRPPAVGGGAGKSLFDALKEGAQRAAITVASFGAAAFGVFKLLERGEKTQNVAAAFDRLSRSIGGAQATLERLNRATGGGVANSELMVAANRLLAAQLGLSADRMEKLFQAGTRLGRALGFTATESVQRLSLALSKQEPELLDELGLKVDLTKAIHDYAEANGVTVDSIDAQTRAAIFLQAVEEQAKERVRGLGEGNLAAATASEVLSKRWSDLTDKFTVMLAQQPGIFEGLKAIAEAVFGLAQALTPVIKLVAELVAGLSKIPGLLPALTGAAVGAAVGGPLGALVGGGVGLIGGLAAGGPSRNEALASAAAPAGRPNLTVNVTVPPHDEAIDRIGARVGSEVGNAMRRRIDDVRGGLNRSVRVGVEGAFTNVFTD